MSHKTFYVTTPIYYVNARPHIGHAYTTIVADVLARRHRLLGDDTFFLTGTDEHGQKIERSAAVAGIPPQQFADQVSKSFEDLWKRMGITNNDYIRTTSEKHKRGVQKLFSTLYERGFIYLASYTGSYCVSDEAFVDAPVGTPCPDCGRLLEEVTEENFFFKLSEFQQPIIELIESGKLSITPESRKNEVLSFVRGGLKDLSISRSSFTWGIPVPEPAANLAAQKHVIYVWLDALANYMTALGYGSDDESLYEKFWPADLHLVGKEIIRFHCVYWPAFLLAAELPLPKAVTAHGWLLFEDSKMSKSKGNIVRTETILDAFGDEVYGKQFPESAKGERDLFASDVLRYFLLREIPFGQDGSFSFDALITRYNADLANGYGNLVSRTLSMIGKYRTASIPAKSDPEFIRLLLGDVQNQIKEAFRDHRFEQALQSIWKFVTSVDQYISEAAPWKLAADASRSADLEAVLYVTAESIRIITALLYPILPFATAKVWAQLGLGDIEAAARNGELNNLEWGGLKPGTKLGPLGPIFPRADKGLAQIMTDMENPTPTDKEPIDPAAVPPTIAPDAAPRTTTLDPAAALPVGGSTALTPGPDPTKPALDPAAVPSPLESPAVESPQITIDDFAKIELRVAQILVAERIPKADKLLRLEVDLGPDFPKRQILSGIAEWYAPDDLIGRRIVVITNLAPRKMRGLESHGMLLAASHGEGGKPVLATFGEDIALGSRLK
ncbi:MAG TPA: methionine--tRNA ligase subunit beta [Acidobacteriaceae bacterium]|jgi:methionyl-tRNA synthetase|nr:methionine--tRNA ligase subunit beta [Acidobacteriaceae bacterium]